MTKLQELNGGLRRFAVLVAFCVAVAGMQPVAFGAVSVPTITIGERVLGVDSLGGITGEYAIFNGSSNYIFAFAVTNPAASFTSGSPPVHYEQPGVLDAVPGFANWTCANIGESEWNAPISQDIFGMVEYPTWSEILGGGLYPFDPSERAFAYSVALTRTLDSEGNLVLHLPGTWNDLIAPYSIQGGFIFQAIYLTSDAIVAHTTSPENPDTDTTFSGGNITTERPPVREAVVPEASSVIVWSLLTALGSVAGWRRCRRTKSE
jgi:hypothetical protein